MCHSSLAARAGIDLQEPSDAYDLLIAERFVIPGDNNSSLLFILEGEQRALMPPDAPLPAADVDLVRTWILEGASSQ